MEGKQQGRLDWLDALRGWAIFGVVIIHCSQVAHSEGLTAKVAEVGQYGVQLFFVVSALTISLTYDSHVAKYGHTLTASAGWLIKRFFRIAPLYYLAAIIYPAVNYFAYGTPFRPLAWLANILFVHTWIPSANNSVVPGGWSIGVEMFFYLLVPTLWLLGKRLRWVALIVGGLLGLLATLAVAYFTTGTFFVGDVTFLYYWFPTEAPVFCLGIAFYFMGGMQWADRVGSSVRALLLGTAAFLIAIGGYRGIEPHTPPILTPAIVAVGFLCVIPALRGAVGRALVSRPMIYLGQISYSVYIFHFLVIDAIREGFRHEFGDHYSPIPILLVVALVLAGTGAIAAVSKRHLEDPFVRMGAALCREISSRPPPAAAVNAPALR